YLRLNGYFTVPGFVVHAGDDRKRISREQVGNYTEVDVLAVRMPNSLELAPMEITNHELLLDGAGPTAGLIDVVIAEVKSGNDSKPNPVWCKGTLYPIEYLVRFVGLHAADEIGCVAKALASEYCYEDKRCRIRYIVIAQQPNKYYQAKGVTYLVLRDAIEFIVKARGSSWIGAGLGVASCHHQWDDMLISLFKIANKNGLTDEAKIDEIETYLAKPS